MTEQFTPEYIEYILSDEAKGLQAKWSPAVGDWYMWAPKKRPHCIEGYELAALEKVGPAERMEVDLVYWLPTLFQLIRIIEGAGWAWKLEYYHLADGRVRYYAYIQNHDIEEYADEIGGDLLLAAAQLAVRAVEGK